MKIEKLKLYLKEIRVKNYIKNVLIFLPIIFSGQMLNSIDKTVNSILGFCLFCFLASLIYVINDLKDIEKDRNHPKKCKRPIASGKISLKEAKGLVVFLIIALIAMNLIISYTYNWEISKIFIPVLLEIIYFVINIGYSFGGKNIPILDVVLLASGFVIRLLFGSSVTGIEISNWLCLTVLSGSFYMGLGKRKNELEKYLKDNTRNVLKYYNRDFLSKNMCICMVLTIVFYSLWAKDTNSSMILWSVAMVLVLAMKYSLNIENKESEGDPVTVIFDDKVFIVLAGLYAVYLFVAIYLV